MRHRATIVTSVPSRLKRHRGQIEVGQVYLLECLTSWKAAGFHVVSLNPKEEVEELEGLGLPIEIRSLDYTGLPLVSDLVRTTEDASNELCGIINSDCAIISLPSLLDRLTEQTTNRLLIAERLDIDCRRGKPFPAACGGYDGFFFRPKTIDWATHFGQSHSFRVGDPWWDYWFPCLAIASGHNVGRVALPILTHLDHPRRWDMTKWRLNAEIFREELRTLQTSKDTPDSFKKLISTILDERPPDVIKISSVFDYFWLSTDCPPVFLFENGGEANYLEKQLCSLRDSATLAYRHPSEKEQRLHEQKQGGEALSSTLLGRMVQIVRDKNRVRLARRRRRKMGVVGQ